MVLSSLIEIHCYIRTEAEADGEEQVKANRREYVLIARFQGH